MSYATPADVRNIAADITDSVDLTGPLRVAAVHSARVAAADTSGCMGAEALVLLEAYLAAHFWALEEPQYKSESTGDGSVSYDQGPKGKGFQATDYGQAALGLDCTGYLAGQGVGRTKAAAYWLGTNPQAEVADLET